jgi:uncharacterized protein (TIGR03435 family)
LVRRERSLRTNTTPFIIIALVLCSATLGAHTFVVASIRPSGPKSVRGSDGGPGSRDPTRYVFGRASLLDLIVVAYDFEDFQISSKSPLERDEFDLAARVPEGATREEFRTMLRNLLADRFHMRAHLETRNFPAFALLVTKGGPKFGSASQANAAASDRFPALKPGRPGMAALYSSVGSYAVTGIRAQQQSIPALARYLRRDASRRWSNKPACKGHMTSRSNSPACQTAPPTTEEVRPRLPISSRRSKSSSDCNSSRKSSRSPSLLLTLSIGSRRKTEVAPSIRVPQ